MHFALYIWNEQHCSDILLSHTFAINVRFWDLHCSDYEDYPDYGILYALLQMFKFQCKHQRSL